jgi:hypothetical protein
MLLRSVSFSACPCVFLLFSVAVFCHFELRLQNYGHFSYCAKFLHFFFREKSNFTFPLPAGDSKIQKFKIQSRVIANAVKQSEYGRGDGGAGLLHCVRNCKSQLIRYMFNNLIGGTFPIAECGLCSL